MKVWIGKIKTSTGYKLTKLDLVSEIIDYEKPDKDRIESRFKKLLKYSYSDLAELYLNYYRVK